ncbi:heliorhodopsin HeR [Candidatus Saccharibacteria bacterium]|nr:MAG: heliorhodopsin HeR [Candidatus Saccharibacteria bacterium]
MKTITTKSLKQLNIAAGFLHLAQGLAVLLLSKSFAIPVSGNYLSFDKASESLLPTTTTLFDVQLPWLIAFFFFLSALFHFVIATVYNKTYTADLKLGLNKLRWVEYSLSASVMMVAISMLVGIYDFSSLLMIFGLTAIMNLLGLVMEVHNQTTKRTNWLSFNLGTLAGLIPWIVVAFYMWLGAANGSAAPTFVYWIFVSIFIFFSCFAGNMILQYKKVGLWRDYIYGERAYIVLSLVAKSLLAWQVFAGTLRP